MSAYRRVNDSRHLQADCKEPDQPHARQSSMGYLFTPPPFKNGSGTDSKAERWTGDHRLWDDWRGGRRGCDQRLTACSSGASMTSRPPGSMLAVTVCGSTASGRSNSRLNWRQLVRPGAASSCRAVTTSLRSTVFTVRSPGSNSAPISTAMRNTCTQRRGVVVSGVRRTNEVNARRARLVPGWVTVLGRVYHLGM